VERARIVRNLSEPQLAKAIKSLLAPSDGRSSLGRRARSAGSTAGRAPRLSDLGRLVGRGRPPAAPPPPRADDDPAAARAPR